MKANLYYTEDLSKIFPKENRPCKDKNVSKLAEAIKTKNLLMQYPIVVTMQMKIVDGQHRYYAARKLGCGIYYLKSNNIDITDVAKINKMVQHWKLSDYIYYFASIGNLNYQRIVNMAKDWDENISMVMNVMGASGSGYRGIISGGTLILNDFKVRYYENIYNKLGSFKLIFPQYKTRSFIAAVKWMLNNKDYDHSRMVKKLPNMRQKFYRCINAEGYAKVLEDVYNYRLQGKKIRIEKKYE